MPRLIIEVGAEEWTTIVTEAIRALPQETGGILMGRWVGPTAALVTDVIGPGPNASHRATSFDPDQAWQETEVARTWAARLGGVAYLGDWHTHPGGWPRPSREDRIAADLIAASNDSGVHRPTMLIVGIRSDGALNPAVYVWSKRHLDKANLLVGHGRRFH